MSQFSLFAALLLLTYPLARMGMGGESDLLRWLIKQPLEEMLRMRAVIVTGIGLFCVGVAALAMEAAERLQP